MAQEINKAITLRKDNFAKWYDDVLYAAKLVYYGRVKGTIIFSENATYIWEQIQKRLNELMKKVGVKNVILPTLIPYSDFALEKEHLEGFAPEMFLVTKKSIDGLEMNNPLVLRPTSEILFCHYFKELLVSYSQLPFKYNQWANVFRVEKNTRPFLRTSEFLWQEMHSIHETKQEAQEFAQTMWKLYEKFVQEFLCIPVISGQKTEGERFAGADNTYTLEALMQDGQALQCATSHFLGLNFSKPYEVSFRNKDNQVQNPYQTSAGLSTRIIGAIIMVHSDDMGLVLPWDIAINQIAICTLGKNNVDVMNYAQDIAQKLNKYNVLIDNSNNSLGFKIKNQQVLGTPFTILIGNKEQQENKITVIFRDLNIKQEFNKDEFINNIQDHIKQFNNRLYTKAKNYLEDNIKVCHTLQEVKQAVSEHHIALAPWTGSAQDEKLLKQQTTISPRCIKCEIVNEEETCFFTNKKAKYWVYFAKAY